MTNWTEFRNSRAIWFRLSTYIIKSKSKLACSSRCKWETSTFGRAIMNICPITHLFNASAAFATSGSTAESRTARISSLSMRTCHFDHTFAIQILLFIRNSFQFQCIECSQFLHVSFDSFLQLRFDDSSLADIVWIIIMTSSLLVVRFMIILLSLLPCWLRVLLPTFVWRRVFSWLLCLCIRWLLRLCIRWLLRLCIRWLLRLLVCWIARILLPIALTIVAWWCPFGWTWCINMTNISRSWPIIAFAHAIVASKHQWWKGACNDQCGEQRHICLICLFWEYVQ